MVPKSRKTAVHSVAPSMESAMCALGLRAVNDTGPCVRPTLASLQQPSSHPFDGDYIFVCIDIEKACLPPRTVSEIGLSYLDTRDLLSRQKKPIHSTNNIIYPRGRLAPGDRGHFFYSEINTFHFRINDCPHNTKHGYWCKSRTGSPSLFGFGKTKWIASEDITSRMNQWMSRLVRRGVDNDKKLPNRTIVMLSWASRMEEDFCEEYGLDWFETNISWDIQKMEFAERSVSWKATNIARIEELIQYLGLAPDIYKNSALLHNGGNDSAFEMQGFIAGVCLSDDQWETLGQEKLTPRLPKSWSAIDQKDAPPS